MKARRVMPLQWPEPEQCRRLAPGPGVFQLGVSVEPLGAALRLGASVVRPGVVLQLGVSDAPLEDRAMLLLLQCSPQYAVLQGITQ